MTSSLKVAFLGVALAAAALASAQITVQVDGTQLNFPNAQPKYINGRVLVPMRGIFEKLGANVNWDRSTRMVTANRGSSNVELRIGDRNAMVNGQNVTLDVPPMMLDGTTLVPIRFVSESLGAKVGWLEARQLVTINTGATGTVNETVVTTPPRRLRRIAIRQNEVIPVTLDQTLSSTDNSRGDTFTATIRTDGESYANIPRDTKVKGHIAAIRARKGNQPAIIDLAFDKLIFPDGHVANIDGTLTSLDGRYVRQGDNGVYMAKTTTTSGQTDQRLVYTGYGAGAGLLLGVFTKKPLEGAVLGGALGYLLGQVQHDRRQASDITLSPGTEMGVKVNQDVAIRW